MFIRLCGSRSLVFALIAVVISAILSQQAMAVSSSFVALANEAGSNADNRRSISFYDSNDIGSGPLFSVFIPFEIKNTSSSAYEEFSSMTVNPSTGDIYFMAFDSPVPETPTTPGLFDPNNTDPGSPAVDTPDDDDTVGDWDLYRINFQTVLSHWTTNYEGLDVRNAYTGGHPLRVGGAMPQATVGATATELQDYVTYGVATPYVEERMLDVVHGPSPDGVFDISHSNTFVLADAVEKVGELNRNLYLGSSNFHIPSLEFIDADTLFMVDDARQSKHLQQFTSANDQDYRVVERVSTSPGAATTNGINGGYNRTTSESWESRRIAQVLLDIEEPTDGFGSPLSEVTSIAYYDNGAGIRGAWVGERDTSFTSGSQPVPDISTGDDIAFLQLDGNFNSLGYRQFVGGATKFEMENNPAAPDGFFGRVGKLFVDADTGDLIVVEEGFTDGGDDDANGRPGAEPAVIRASVNYNSGGQIALTWGAKMFLNPVKDTGDTFNERGYWSAYDSATDKVYFASPGGNAETPAFQSDLYVLDLATGLTTSFNNIDASVSLFFGGSNPDWADNMVAFTLAAAGIAGDYNDDGTVDAADYVVFRKNEGTMNMLPNDPNGGTIGTAQYNTWRANFGMMAPGSGGAAAVPEPASAMLIVLGLAALSGCRRRAGR